MVLTQSYEHDGKLREVFDAALDDAVAAVEAF
jgi:hypothetical protein